MTKILDVRQEVKPLMAMKGRKRAKREGAGFTGIDIEFLDAAVPHKTICLPKILPGSVDVVQKRINRSDCGAIGIYMEL